MTGPTYYLNVRRPVPFMSSLVEVFCGDALPVVGLAKQVIHVQIEQHRELVFGAYDEFCESCDGCVWVTRAVGPEFLDRLKKDGCLRSYEPAPDTGVSGEQRLASLLAERDISLDEALRAFGSDRHCALQVLSTYLSTGSMVLKNRDEILDGPKVRQLFGGPAGLEAQGALRLSPASVDDKAQEQGQKDDPLEWMAIIADLWRPDGQATKKKG